jgi:hypothetical protein
VEVFTARLSGQRPWPVSIFSWSSDPALLRDTQQHFLTNYSISLLSLIDATIAVKI